MAGGFTIEDIEGIDGEGFIIARGDLNRFGNACIVLGVKYQVTKMRKNLVVVDMDAQDYLKVEEALDADRKWRRELE